MSLQEREEGTEREGAGEFLGDIDTGDDMVGSGRIEKKQSFEDIVMEVAGELAKEHNACTLNELTQRLGGTYRVTESIAQAVVEKRGGSVGDVRAVIRRLVEKNADTMLVERQDKRDVPENVFSRLSEFEKRTLTILMEFATTHGLRVGEIAVRLNGNKRGIENLATKLGVDGDSLGKVIEVVAKLGSEKTDKDAPPRLRQ